MTLDDLIDIARRALRDTVGADADRYWRDIDIEEYLNEAQEELVKRTHCLVESLDTALCTITLAVNQHSYPISDNILAIDEVRPSWQQTPLTDSCSFHFFDQGWASAKGRPSAFCLDYQNNYITFDKSLTTVDGETVSMTVRRMPKVMTTTQDAEIPREYQRALRHKVMNLAFLAMDSEIKNPGLADQAQARWEKALAEIVSQEANKRPKLYAARSAF